MKKSFSKSSGMRATKSTFFIVVIIVAILGIIAATGIYVPGVIEVKGAQEIRLGIDIRGGFEAVLAPASSYEGEVTNEDINSARSIIELRMDNLNIVDREVFIDRDNRRIVVRAPWRSDEEENDADEALKELGEMALLTFRDPDDRVVLEGKNVSRAYASIDPETNRPVVVLELDSEGRGKFADATSRLVGENIGIYMDDTQLSNPVVRHAITGGEATITGMESTAAARDLAEKIQAGNLPFALESITSSQISAALGSDAMDVMIYAAIVAFILICLFMVIYYRLPGFVAVIAISGQTIGQLLAVSVPQFTLTLPGIAAIILSIGMGVDANIIIAERIKEELRMGSPLKIAVRNGFERALAPVIDGNITCAISAAILMLFGSGSFMSFGYLLLTGVTLNILFGVIATRLMTKSLLLFPALSKKWLYNGGKEAV